MSVVHTGARFARVSAFSASLMLLPAIALADPAGARLGVGASAYLPLGFVLTASVISVIAGLSLRAALMKASAGTDAMQRVGQAIRDGANAYLFKQVRAMLPLVGLISIGLFFLFHSQANFTVATALGAAVAFIAGVGCSYAAGYVGMGMATAGNQRVAYAALSSYKSALEIAFRSGAVAGLMTVGLGLFGATLVFFLFGGGFTNVLVGGLEGFGFGGSLAALFMRVGGGIYTKSADVGADIVGKIELDLPEDDPRNAATIADNVGDNVGDCAGMAADVFESYIVTLIAAIVLGSVIGGPTYGLALVLFPLVIHAVGIIASIIGIFSLRGKEQADLDPLVPINATFWLTAAIAVIGFSIAAFVLPGIKDGIVIEGKMYGPLYFIGATSVGVVLALVIGRMTEYFTGTDKRPVTEVAHAAQTGPATLILSGFSLGLESATWGAGVVVLALFGIVLLFAGNGLLAAYGTALAGLGLLTTTGYVLAMDTFGPISDNAQGIFEMSHAAREMPKSNGTHPVGALPGDRVVAKLDAAGNTTKALTKGYAIATAVIAAVALFRAFMTDAHLSDAAFSLASPRVFIGLLIGGAAPYLFSSFAINAVSRAAGELVMEVRRQLKEIPGIMDGSGVPNYARCVDIATAAAQKELLGPGILAIFLPILVGFGLGPRALGGFLAGAIVSGQLMAVLLANSGGAWDNAKKKIEDGLFGGKGTDEHKASIVGDTVGDPFKDTAGPALNPLIKVMNLVGVLIAGVTASNMNLVLQIGVVVIAAGLLAGAILFSKRGGMMALTDTEGALERQAKADHEPKSEEKSPDFPHYPQREELREEAPRPPILGE